MNGPPTTLMIEDAPDPWAKSSSRQTRPEDPPAIEPHASAQPHAAVQPSPHKPQPHEPPPHSSPAPYGVVPPAQSDASRAPPAQPKTRPDQTGPVTTSPAQPEPLRHLQEQRIQEQPFQPASQLGYSARATGVTALRGAPLPTSKPLARELTLFERLWAAPLRDRSRLGPAAASTHALPHAAKHVHGPAHTIARVPPHAQARIHAHARGLLEQHLQVPKHRVPPHHEALAARQHARHQARQLRSPVVAPVSLSGFQPSSASQQRLLSLRAPGDMYARRAAVQAAWR